MSREAETDISQAVALIAAGRRLYERRILASYEGNLSVRLGHGAGSPATPGTGDGERILTTPSGVHKGRLEPDDLVLTDLSGTPLNGRVPSSELPMHLAVYQERPDLRAIVHAHPPTATGYAVAGRRLPTAALAEVVTMLGCVPVAPYGTPSTDELADAVREPVRSFDVLLLANHGALTAGIDLEQAEERMHQLEHFAEIALVSHLLGGPQSLSTEQVARLSELRERGGGRPVPPACYPSDDKSGTITLTRAQLVELIADAVRTIR